MTIPEAFNLAVQHQHAGKFAEAEAIYRQILAQQPAQWQTRLNLGSILDDSGRSADAISVYRMGLAFDHTQAELWSNLGNSLHKVGEVDQALAACRQALSIQPELATAHNNLGNAVKSQSKASAAKGEFPVAERLLAEAKIHFQNAIACRPDFAVAHNNLGTVLHAQGDLDGSEASLRRAMELDPNYVQAMANFANILCERGLRQEAIQQCRRAIELKPEFEEAHWNLGLMLLRMGDFAGGWEEYEWRWRVKDLIQPQWKFPQPRWDGGELGGKQILLHAEQGFGDAIQFARYAPLVARRGGRVVLYCQPDLARLLRSLPDVQRVVPWDQPACDFDVQCPLLTLPRLFHTDLTNIPNQVPYLTAEAGLKDAWQVRLKSQEGLKVGLVWAGRPTHVSDLSRSIPLARFRPLADVPGIRLISLQKGPAARQAARLEFPLLDWTSELNDLADTAALIDQLDLVVTVDTAVAHLAGALGKRVWVLLPHTPDWRWMLDREDSPWYPTVRLFRQKAIADWTWPIEEVVKALKEN
jgi:tetratricopeptide (TPR) repeat protein